MMTLRPGDVVDSHFNPAIVTASYFASLCGTWLTAELLHRRGTGVRSWASWLWTFACATSLGLIGIWCMHFIGNRAIVLGDGESAYQLVYSPGYSTLSVFLPIAGLSIAFAAAEYPARSSALHWTLLCCTGVIAGLSVVAMHYVGNFGVSNYQLEYKPQFLAASIIIAIGDCLAVLILFYTWREKWISDWWKRLACAIFLAGGVSAMHFTASTNCIYKLKELNAVSAIHSRDVQVIVAGIMCGAAGGIILCVLFFTRHRARVLKDRSQKIMLACAMFDSEGRILVTTEGVLPSREITDKFSARTFDEEFDIAHPVFQWIFRVSRNWFSVVELIPKMKSHLTAHRVGNDIDSRPSSSASSATYDPETYNDYSVIFRERFCTATASLAASLTFPVHKVGVLYDNIVETGTLTSEEKVVKRSTLDMAKTFGEVEMGMGVNVFGKGQLLFLTRQLSDLETDRLLNAGFKFAGLQQVGRTIAGTMQIPLAALEAHMLGLTHYLDNLSNLQKPGTWLSFFAMIPKPNSKGFDVVVKREEQDQLPDVQLLSAYPSPWQAAILERMDRRTLANCISFLEDSQRRNAYRTPQEQHFALVVLRAMLTLGQQLPAQWFHSARFHGRQVYAHYSQPLRDRAPVTTMYSFVLCADVHTSIEARGRLTRVPLSFFTARQQCYSGSPNHAEMARDIHQEFAPLFSRRVPEKEDQRVKKISIHMSNGSSKKLTKSSSRRPSMTHTLSFDRTDTSDDTFELVEKPQHSNDFAQDSYSSEDRDQSSVWGGILVNSETVVKSDVKSDYSPTHRHVGLEMGIETAVGTSKPENTFVDDLVAVARGTIGPKSGH